jgi:hypothetical protein
MIVPGIVTPTLILMGVSAIWIWPLLLVISAWLIEGCQ